MCRVTCRGKVATVHSCEAPSLSLPLGSLKRDRALGLEREICSSFFPSSGMRGVVGSSDIVALSKVSSELFKAEEFELGRDLDDELKVGSLELR